MKLLYISGREPAYPRNSIIIKALKTAGVEMIECTSSARRYPSRYLSSLLKIIGKKDYDLIFTGFFGQPLVPVITSMTSKPVVLDAFISGFDTMCFDRKRFQPESWAGKSFCWLDRRACELASLVICDTNAHIDYFSQRFSIDRSKFARVFVGAEEDIFYPRAHKDNGSGLSVLYYGTYLPLHGFEYVVRAAKLLEGHEDIRFKIIGKGMMKDKVYAEANMLKVKNVEFVDWVPYHRLPGEIAKADICLGGHFSNSGKASRVIAGKAFQMAAIGKPLILGDYEANRELFEHGEDAYFTRPADAVALAEAIVKLKEDGRLREEISKNAFKKFQKECNLDQAGNRLRSLIETMG